MPKGEGIRETDITQLASDIQRMTTKGVAHLESDVYEELQHIPMLDKNKLDLQHKSYRPKIWSSDPQLPEDLVPVAQQQRRLNESMLNKHVEIPLSSGVGGKTSIKNLISNQIDRMPTEKVSLIFEINDLIDQQDKIRRISKEQERVKKFKEYTSPLRATKSVQIMPVKSVRSAPVLKPLASNMIGKLLDQRVDRVSVVHALERTYREYSSFFAKQGEAASQYIDQTAPSIQNTNMPHIFTQNTDSSQAGDEQGLQVCELNDLARLEFDIVYNQVNKYTPSPERKVIDNDHWHISGGYSTCRDELGKGDRSNRIKAPQRSRQVDDRQLVNQTSHRKCASKESLVNHWSGIIDQKNKSVIEKSTHSNLRFRPTVHHACDIQNQLLKKSTPRYLLSKSSGLRINKGLNDSTTRDLHSYRLDSRSMRVINTSDAYRGDHKPRSKGIRELIIKKLSMAQN